jgi:hypothetical protein
MNSRTRKYILISIYATIFILLFLIQLIWLSDFEHSLSINATRSAIVSENLTGAWDSQFATVTQNPIVETLISQTATAQAPSGTLTPTPTS